MAKRKEEKKQLVSWLQPLMMVLLVGAAFAIGSMWTEMKSLKSNKKVNVAQDQAVEPQAPKGKTELTEEEWKQVLIDPAVAIGDENAPVTLVEFTDFQCPFCGRFAKETHGQIMDDYVKTGKLRYMVRDLPLPFHPHSQEAAEAMRCAGDQDKYMEMYEKMFAMQDEWAELAKVTDTYVGYAGTLGLDTASFSECLSSGAKTEIVKTDSALAEKLKINGTPSFVVNGKILVGAQPFVSFQKAIEVELK